jgi:hypothetical protein
MHVGRNLQVIESEAARSHWNVRFRVGNPERERQPVALELGAGEGVEATLLVKGRRHAEGEPVWLDGGEEVDARLLLHAPTGTALESASTVEAWINGRFIDGIQVVISRPAFVSRTSFHNSEPTSAASEVEALLSR